MKISAIIQSRMSSSRLPGKVLHKIQGKPMLGYLLESVSHCREISSIQVATSSQPDDDPIEDFCRSIGVACSRGSLEDVATRFFHCATACGCDAFVRLCGDSPLLDYRLVDKACVSFRDGAFDLATNVLVRTYPKGQSVEIVSAESFARIQPFLSQYQREHVTTYFYQNRDQFRIYNFESGFPLGETRLSVDTAEDMARVKALLSRLDKPHWKYSYLDFTKML